MAFWFDMISLSENDFLEDGRKQCVNTINDSKTPLGSAVTLQGERP